MKSNRNKIKNDVLQKTETEISKIQADYEKLIKSLEEALEKKLVELKKE
jgi:ribosome recycling factor